MDQYSHYYIKEKIKMPLQEAIEKGYVKPKILTVVINNEDGTTSLREKNYFPVNNDSYIVKENAYIVDLEPKQVEPINKTIKKVELKSRLFTF